MGAEIRRQGMRYAMIRTRPDKDLYGYRKFVIPRSKKTKTMTIKKINKILDNTRREVFRCISVEFGKLEKKWNRPVKLSNGAIRLNKLFANMERNKA